MTDQPNMRDNPEMEAIERLLDEDASILQEDAPAGLDDRILMASQRALAASPPNVVVRNIRWLAPLAAAAGLAVATTILWPTGTTRSAPMDNGEAALLEADFDAVVLAADIDDELTELDAFLESLDELENAFAMNWTENISLLESEFEIEEIVQ